MPSIRAGLLLAALAAAVPALAQTTDSERQCVAGNAETCARIAELALTGEAGPKDLPRASAYFLRACAGAQPDKPYCTGAGVAVELARRNDEDARKLNEGLAAMAKACEAGSMNECNAVAISRLFGAAGQPDAEGAKALFDKTCDAGVTSACANLADLLAKGSADERRKAVGLYGKACKGDSAWTCKIAGLAEVEGIGGQKDLVQAARYFKRGCDGRDKRSCMLLLSLYQQDPAGAPALFRKACANDFKQCAEYEQLVQGAQAAQRRNAGPPR